MGRAWTWAPSCLWHGPFWLVSAAHCCLRTLLLASRHRPAAPACCLDNDPRNKGGLNLMMQHCRRATCFWHLHLYAHHRRDIQDVAKQCHMAVRCCTIAYTVACHKCRLVWLCKLAGWLQRSCNRQQSKTSSFGSPENLGSCSTGMRQARSMVCCLIICLNGTRQSAGASARCCRECAV